MFLNLLLKLHRVPAAVSDEKAHFAFRLEPHVDIAFDLLEITADIQVFGDFPGTTKLISKGVEIKQPVA